MKLKLSSQLLIALCVLVVSSLVASNLLIKKEYDRIDKNDPNRGYKKILDKPFKHLKVIGGDTTFEMKYILASDTRDKKDKMVSEILFRPDSQYGVYLTKNDRVLERHNIDTEMKVELQNDTLIITIPTIDNQNYYSENALFRIYAPNLESVTGVNAQIGIDNCNYPTFNAQLSGKSNLVMWNGVQSMTEMSINVQGNSTFKICKYLNIKDMHANLQGQSKLNMPETQIEKLHLNASDYSTVEMTNNTLKALVK